MNHNGDLLLARRLVDVAADAGADAVKFQSFKADLLVAPDAPKADYQLETTPPGESQHQMLSQLELSEDAQHELFDYCADRGILFLSTPFDDASADFLDSLPVVAFKIGSSELTNLPFLDHVARKGKPLIVSTGMSDLAEVGDAVRTIRSAGNLDIVVLHCVSDYPADPGQANIRAIATIRQAFDVLVGYSDHTVGIEVALGAVALGSCVLEKHITLDRQMPGPDHRASLEPRELKSLVRGVRIVESSLGSGKKVPSEGEARTAEIARRSLVAARDIPEGAVLTEELVTSRRPGTGLSPAMLSDLIGRTTKVPVLEGHMLNLDMFA